MKRIAISLVLAILVVSFAPSIASAEVNYSSDDPLNVIQSDSVTMSASGDTSEVSFSSNATTIQIVATNNSVSMSFGTADATDSDLIIPKDEFITISPLDLGTINFYNNDKNTGHATVRVRAYN